MSQTLETLQKRIAEVGELYARRFNIERSADWYLLKLQEELGELTAEYMVLTDRARASDEDRAEARLRLENEAADLFGQFMLFVDANGVDIESAIERKWLSHLDNIATGEGE